jgi:hypothetical protein
MTEQTDGVWRDEEKLPLSELNQAMATWDTDGQADDNDSDTPPENAAERPGFTGQSGPN